MTQNYQETKIIPHHIAIILDGNRRWAKERGISVDRGHLEGANNLAKIAKLCAKKGIKILTVYAFSTENQKRSEKEKQGLFRIFRQFMKKYRGEFKKNGIKLKVLGDIVYFPEDLQKEITKTIEILSGGNKFELCMALNYGGRADVVQAVEKIIKAGVRAGDVTEKMVSDNLYSAPDPDPDIIVRPGGEQRLSNFLIWQASYSELYFCPEHWPAFDEKSLERLIEEYNRRERRFGK